MEHRNAQLLRRAWAAYDRGDVEAFASCLTDDWREYGPEGEARGFATLEDERPTMEAHRLAFPDKHTEIVQVVADDGMVGCIDIHERLGTKPALEPFSLSQVGDEGLAGEPTQDGLGQRLAHRRRIVRGSTGGGGRLEPRDIVQAANDLTRAG